MSASFELLRAVDPTAHLRALVPSLTISPGLRAGDLPGGRSGEGAPLESMEHLAKDGYVVLPRAETADAAARLATAIGSLVDAGLPAVFVYAFDEIWELGERARARLQGVLGRSYALLNDVWAWRIDPGSQGWPPHRGTATLLDREAPEVVNVWIALRDVAADGSCIHVVPLDDDPAYPARLEHVAAPHSGERALAIPAGTALAWNANILHWGGRCSPTAAPRFSCSFSLARGAMADTFPAVETRTMQLADRLDAIALQIGIYGAGQADVSAEVREWALARTTLRNAIAALSRPNPTT